LSSEPDRYRGRRRVPTPPRSRYAVVGLSAFVGAGVVALGAGATLPDAKAVPDTVLQGLEDASLSADQFAARAEDDKASRDERSGAAEPKLKEVAAEDLYELPLEDFTFTSPYGVRWGSLHAGIDLAADEGTPYKAIHAGVVTKAGYQGGYGYSVTVQQPDGTEIIYGHSRRVLVQKGQQVKAGDVLGEVGSTGYTYGNHLHVEVHVKGKPVDPVPTLRAKGVDFILKISTPYSAAS
jgi:murein DD-endopeptidase MepM/ murein hydrolase activator NlpD